MNKIYQKSKTCQKPAIEISVACQAGQGKPARQGRKNLPLAGLAGQVADPRYLVAFAPLVFLLDLLHFLLGEVILDVEVLKERLISWF